MDNVKTLLNEPMTTDEISKAIDATKLGQAPGPGEFTAKFYKKFKKDLVLVFQILINDTVIMKEILK